MQRPRLALAVGLLVIGTGAVSSEPFSSGGFSPVALRAQAPAVAVAQVTVAADQPGPAIASTM